MHRFNQCLTELTWQHTGGLGLTGFKKTLITHTGPGGADMAAKQNQALAWARAKVAAAEAGPGGPPGGAPAGLWQARLHQLLLRVYSTVLAL